MSSINIFDYSLKLVLCFTAFNITLWVIPSSTFKTNRQFFAYSIIHVGLL